MRGLLSIRDRLYDLSVLADVSVVDDLNLSPLLVNQHGVAGRDHLELLDARLNDLHLRRNHEALGIRRRLVATILTENAR